MVTVCLRLAWTQWSKTTNTENTYHGYSNQFLHLQPPRQGRNGIGDIADFVTNLCHLSLRYDFVNRETTLTLASMRIGSIIRNAFAGDMGDIADRLVLPRLGDGVSAHCGCPPNAPAEVQTFIFGRPKGYFGFLTS
jgi:hypothetical protein